MSRTKQQIRNTYLSHAIRIKGRTVNIDFARIVYRCEECLGKLKRHNAGLVCTSDNTHHGFIHRDEAATIAAEREAQFEQVSAVYEIVDGQIVVKEN